MRVDIHVALTCEARELSFDLEEGHYSMVEAVAMIRRLANMLDGYSDEDVVGSRGDYKVGDPVWVYDKLAGRNKREAAVIVGFLDDIVGGVILDRKVSDFRCWNVVDLKPRKEKKDDHG